MSKVVIVVDDRANVVFSVKQGLEDLDSNYEVIGADSGEQCLEMLKNDEIPDLILLDITMSGMSGWDVAAEIKKNPKWSDVPIVFLTAKTDDSSKAYGNIVSKDYIEKPFEIEDLKKRIDIVLER